MVVDTTSSQGFNSSSDITAAIQVSVSDSEADYLHAVNGYTDDSPASAHIYVADLLIAFSSRADWVVFGSSKADIAICAITDLTAFSTFSSIYSSDSLGGIEAAAEYAFGVSNVSLKRKLRLNYSS